MCVLCHMVCVVEEGSWCVSERRQDFFSKSGCGWWYAGRIFLQVFVVVACDMWCVHSMCGVQ